MNKKAVLQRAKMDPTYRKRVIAQLRSQRFSEEKRASSGESIALLKKLVDWNDLRAIKPPDVKESFLDTIDSFVVAIGRSNLAYAVNAFNNAIDFSSRGSKEEIEVALFKVRNLLK